MIHSLDQIRRKARVMATHLDRRDQRRQALQLAQHSTHGAHQTPDLEPWIPYGSLCQVLGIIVNDILGDRLLPPRRR